jgi:dTDP-4-amino-4,6-dideoxygalactose transaminase
VDRARILYDKGTNRRAFLLGQVDKYSWKDTGSSFGLADVLAAYLLAQLEERRTIQARRRAIHERYAELLAPHAGELFEVPEVPPDRGSAYHMFHLLLPDHRRRNEVLARLREVGIQATFHYVPLHTSDAGRRFAARPTECPVTDDVSGRLLRLPFWNGLPLEEVDRVAEQLLACVRSLEHPR